MYPFALLSVKAALFTKPVNWRKLNLEGAIFLSKGKTALYQINKLFHYPPKGTKGVSQKAFVDVSAKIGKRVNIGPFSYVGANCVIGDNVTIFSNVTIMNNVVIDDGTISDKRGSLTIDDEGTPTQKTVLIEDGILKGYMQDRMNARLMGVEPTGNGRRQSYAYAPIPRMTNTYMPAGQHDPEEILQSMQNGLYATNFGGGQVDITSGKFVFTCTEAYVVENGKIGAPVKGATLIGNGPDVLTRVSMIGNDFALDPGVGTCGKDGQGVPCGVGQPTIKVQKLTVGGTAA